MKSLLVLVGIPAVALAAALLFVVETRIVVTPAMVYTVAQARAGMMRQPRSWAGRTVLVRARAFPLGTNCPPSIPWCTNVVLADGDALLATAPTLVAMAAGPARPDPLVSLLRHVPLADRLIRQPQQVDQVDWSHIATYRVHLSAQSFSPCIAPCINVQLEGIAP
jgi:hypothetical protein